MWIRNVTGTTKSTTSALHNGIFIKCRRNLLVKCRRHMAENETENSRYAIGETTELEWEVLCPSTHKVRENIVNDVQLARQCQRQRVRDGCSLCFFRHTDSLSPDITFLDEKQIIPMKLQQLPDRAMAILLYWGIKLNFHSAPTKPLLEHCSLQLNSPSERLAICFCSSFFDKTIFSEVEITPESQRSQSRLLILWLESDFDLICE